MEIWKKIKNYEDYEVSNYGRIKSLDRYVNGKNNSKRLCKGKIFKITATNNSGYFVVSLGRGNLKLLHRLIAEAFIPNPNNLPCIDHIDINPKNNSIDNLRWCTHKENFNNPLTRKKMSETHKNKLITDPTYYDILIKNISNTRSHKNNNKSL